MALAPQCFPEPRVERALSGARFVPGFGDLLAQAFASTLDPALVQLLWRAIFLPQPMPPDFTWRFPTSSAAGPERIVTEGEDAVNLWPALVSATQAYPACRTAVRISGGTLDRMVNNVTNGLLATRRISDARLGWLPGTSHMPHHVHQERIAAEVTILVSPTRHGPA